MSTEDTEDTVLPAAAPARGRRRRSRLRWGRFAAMMVTSAAAAGTLVVLTAQGALAVSFSISGMPFVVTSSHVVGTGFEQYAALDLKSGNNPTDPGGDKFVLVSAMGTATLDDLCQSIDAGFAQIVLTAGGNGSKIYAEDMVLDSTDLTAGNAQFTNINIGQDASELDAVNKAAKAIGKNYKETGPAGLFGQQSETVVLDKLRQTNYATTAAVFKLPNLHLTISQTGCP